MTPRVAIVGGGYAGVALAAALRGRAEVTLIERRDRFYHAVAALRAAADPAWVDRILIPYDAVPATVVHDEVTALHPDGVTLTSGAGVEAEVWVLATGSSYAFPAKTELRGHGDIRAAHAALHARIRASRRVVVLGGGPVGVELAGELATRIAGLEVHLVEAGDALVSGPYHPALRVGVRAALDRVGVRVHTGVRWAAPPADGERVELGGESFTADLVLPMIGARPSPLPARSGFPVDAAGRVQVGPDFSVPGWPRWFAIGDATALPEPKVSTLAEAHAKCLAHGIVARANGRAAPAWRPPAAHALVVPVGDRDGAGQLPVLGGVVVGGLLTSWIKGRSLFVERRWRKLGHPRPPW
ncbi:MAG: FAD-dependent oxidoreductase [Myxococcota bacterium]